MVATYDDLIARVAASYRDNHYINGNTPATTATALTGQLLALQRTGRAQSTPGSLPSGVTSYLPTIVEFVSSTAALAFLVARVVQLGSIDISTNTFTDGSSMGTRTVGNATYNLWSPVFMEVTTTLNATPGSIAITYVDQDGNSAEANTAVAMTASAVAKTIGIMTLNGTDIGVRDITAATRTLGTSPTGVVRFLGIDPIALMPGNPTAGSVAIEDMLTQDFSWCTFGVDSEFAVISVGNSAAKAVVGRIVMAGLD